MKNLIILIAQVRFPENENSYLVAESYVVGLDIKELDAAVIDFKTKNEADGFSIINFTVYVVPNNHLLSIGLLDLIANKFMRPVRCDCGAKG